MKKVIVKYWRRTSGLICGFYEKVTNNTPLQKARRATTIANLPEEISSSNQWIGHRMDDVCHLFKRFDPHDLEKLEKGMLIWFDSESPHGKAYGYVSALVTSVTHKDGTVSVTCSGTYIERHFEVNPQSMKLSVYYCTDPEKVLKVSRQQPMMTNMGTYPRRS